jgi:hypothetical protein
MDITINLKNKITMKKLVTVLMLSAFTFGTFVASANTGIQQDTTKKKKETTKKDTTKKPVRR